MSKQLETYQEHVTRLEGPLAPYAKRSFETFSPVFVDGGEMYKHYADQWNDPSRSARLAKRTPLQIERDRILYSHGVRKQTEKYHVIYNGQRRIVRNFTTHTMRMAQVTRAISRGLELNSDFAEAMALGSKVGALPFVHASKDAVSDWVRKKIIAIDKDFASRDPLVRPADQQLSLDFGRTVLPSWVLELRSSYVLDRIQKFIPWAAGRGIEKPHTSGQQGYWHLCTNPYTVESRANAYSPETMFGIWRHTRGLALGKDCFYHKCRIDGAQQGFHELKAEHCTYEGMVVQYADDITWIIENLNDANSAALLNNRQSVYEALSDALEEDRDTPEYLFRALRRNDSGALYTYFINDFIRNSQAKLQALGDGAVERVALRGSPSGETAIGLSVEAERQIERMGKFLDQNVFTEPRVKNRFTMLRTISVACIDLLYNGDSIDGVLSKVIRERGILERWLPEKQKRAEELIKDPIHRIQLAVNIFADMGDQEIYDFVGIQAL